MSRIQAMVFALVAGLGLHPGQAAAAGAWSPLLAPAELNALMAADEEVLLVDIRPVKAYMAGHVEGAVSSPYHGWRGPEENPGRLIGADKLTLNLQQIGIEPDSRVVVTYQGADASGFGAAARVYWTIKSAGVGEVAILNGGVDAWTDAGFALSTEEAANFASDVEYEFLQRWLADEGEVAEAIAGEGEALLVDARPLAFFRGEDKHDAASWAGTLPEAVQLAFASWFADEGPIFRGDAQTIRERARAAGWTPGTPVVSFCNTGHWAAINWFALSEIAGIEDVKLYPESMVGWTRAHDS